MKLLKVSEVMGKLSISRGKAYQMIRNGVILSVNIDGCIRIPEEHLDEMIYRQLIERAGEDRESIEKINNLCGGRAERSAKREWPGIEASSRVNSAL